VEYGIQLIPLNEIVKKSEEKANGNNQKGEYGLLLNNCEHFATEVSCGIRQCDQISKFSHKGETVGG